MSNFWGNSFIFDGVNSEQYDLKIYELNPSNPSSSGAGGDVSIYEKWLYKRESPYYYGRYYTNSLEFDFMVGSYSHIDAISRNAIEAWLTGQNTYKPLKIVQDDMTNITYNVIITQSTHVYIGNMNYALTLHAKCDRPWGLYYPPKMVRNYKGGVANEKIIYLNESVFDGYNKPLVSFIMGAQGDYFQITNVSDGGRVFRFDDLLQGEEISVDNDKGIITSNTSLLRMSKFNKNFFRLVRGNNTLLVEGNIRQFSIQAVFPKGIGA